MMRFWVFVFFIILPSFIAASGSRAEETVLRFTLQQALTDPVGKNILEFKQEVEAKAKGTLKIEILDKGQLYPDYQVPEVVGGGTVEMGITPLAQYAKFLPIAGVFMQPFLFNFEAIVQAAAQPGSEIRQVLDAAILKDTGARVLWWYPHGWNVIFSKGPIANPQALTNRNVRVFDDVAAEFVTLCGGNPQVISESKQVEALQLNLVDSSMTSIASIKNYELWHTTDTITNIRHSANILVALINDDVWKKLTEDQRKILTQAALNSQTKVWAQLPATEADIYSYAGSKGMKVIQLTPDDTIAWRICSSPILESFVSRSGALGAKLIAAYGKLRADPCCNPALRSSADNSTAK